MPTLLNRARMSTATTGTGTVTLGSAVTGFLTFAEAGASNGVTYPYVIEDGNDFEIGVGTYTSSGTTFSRDTVTASKIGGTAGTSKIDLSGSATIFLTARATDILNPANNLSDVATPATAATNLGLGTGNTPQFTGIEVGHASDTTLTRASAGNLAVEGNALYRAGGTDVALADGGTGASLTDPDADRIMFWDDSAGAITWLTAGTGLTITGTTMTASGVKAVDRQNFDSSGTWTKPSGYGASAIALIQAWGAGGGGGRYSSTNMAGGGGGGGYSERWVLLSALGSTETVTIGAGGAGKSGSSGNGSAGGTTTFGSWVTAYGGGGGGMVGAGGGMGGNQNGAGTTATPFGYTDAASAIVYRLLDPFSGGNGKGYSNGAAGADAMRGGGGGAGASYTTGGVSQNGGNGGGGGASPSAGTQPGGGGGGSSSANVDGAAGAAGRVIVTVFDGA